MAISETILEATALTDDDVLSTWCLPKVFGVELASTVEGELSSTVEGDLASTVEVELSSTVEGVLTSTVVGIRRA
jgi:hypothetical protein